MIDIDITHLCDGDTWSFAGSILTHGKTAARDTWNTALEAGRDHPLLTLPEHFAAVRAWARNSGGWDSAEIAAWSDDELNALALQLVTLEMREIGLEGDDPDDFDWKTRGTGAIFRADDGAVYYSFE